MLSFTLMAVQVQYCAAGAYIYRRGERIKRPMCIRSFTGGPHHSRASIACCCFLSLSSLITLQTLVLKSIACGGAGKVLESVILKTWFKTPSSGSSQSVSVCSPISLGDLQPSQAASESSRPPTTSAYNPFICLAHYKDDHLPCHI